MPSTKASSSRIPTSASKLPAAKKKAPAAPEPPKQLSLEERTASLEQRLLKADPHFQTQYRDSLDMSWINHDSALEGVVYTMQELTTATDPNATFVGDSSLQPICEEIRRHREALHFIRDYAAKRKQPITLDTLKRIYTILHPEEGDIKTVKYRRDVPQHRLYFHEYTAPDKIAPKMRQILDWVNDPETRKSRSPVRIAARAQYDIVRVFPFQSDSGKVGRLFMNLLLLRAGCPPAIIHSAERQRYYEALKGSSTTMTAIVQESIDNSLASIEKMLDAYEKSRSGR